VHQLVNKSHRYLS